MNDPIKGARLLNEASRSAAYTQSKVDRALAKERQVSRRAAGKAWSAYLQLALDEKAEDGTPIMELVLAYNPKLRERLKKALDVTNNDRTATVEVNED